MTKNDRLLFFLLAVSLSAVMPGRADTGKNWDFQDGAGDWKASGKDGGVVAEPGNEGNHAFQIHATRAHHTRVSVPDSGKSPDFFLSFRYRVVDSTGAPPTVYLYGRSSKGGFRGLALTPADGGGRVFCYRGQDGPNPTLGQLPPAECAEGGWMRVAAAFHGPNVLARQWPDGTPEPQWQVAGKEEGQETGQAELGVWTSPTRPSTARVLFDDVRFLSLPARAPEEWASWLQPRPVLAASEIPGQAGTFSLPGRAGICAGTLALTFDKTTGDIVNLVDRSSGREFIGRESRRPLFRIGLTKPAKGELLEIDPRGLGPVKVLEEKDSLSLEFPDAGGRGVTARVTAKSRADGKIALGIKVENRSGWSVAQVDFPGMAMTTRLGEDGADDRLLLPIQGGALVPDPGARRFTRSAAYPGSAFAQFYAYYDDTAGLSVAMEDARGRCKEMQPSSDGHELVVGLRHRFPEETGGSRELPYEVVLTGFRGDWRDAADDYKAWAVKNLWDCPLLAQREDVPAFLKEGAAVVISGFRGEKGAHQQFGEDGRKLLDTLDEYRERTGLKHMIFVPYGWENRGTWAGIHYLPAQPSNEYWEKVNALLREHDHRSGVLLSGYWWVIKRKETGSGPAFDDTAEFERRSGMCVTKADGSPWLVDEYENTTSHGSWRGLSAGLCHGSSEAADVLAEQFLGAAKLGFSLVSFDQEIGGGQRAPCYHLDHRHPPGYGAWMWTGFHDLCERIREEGKAFEPEIGLFLENTSELAVPLMATYWSRQFSVVDIGGIHGSRGTGLFSYLYHEYVTAIGAACVQGQGPLGTRPDVLVRCRALANNLTRGLIPGPFLHDVPLKPGNDPWKKAVSAAFLSYCRPYAKFSEYLILGRTRRPCRVECGQVASWYWKRRLKGDDQRDPAKVADAKAELLLEAVTAGSFEAGDGSRAHFIVNATPDPQKATAILPAEGEAIVFSADRRELKKIGAAEGERRVPFDLEPFGVRVIVVR